MNIYLYTKNNVLAFKLNCGVFMIMHINMREVSIQPKLLLAVYSLIPLALVIFIVDVTLLNLNIKSSIAADPNDYALFTAIFTLPHILASFFGFFDREYIQYYGKKILRGAQYAFIAIMVLMAIDADIMLFVFAIYTMVHVFLQQSGITKSLSKGINAKSFNVWQWSGVAISSLLYAFMYTNAIQPSLWFAAVLTILVIIFITASLFTYKKCNTRVGMQYFLLTTSIPIIVAIFVAFDYNILALALPRVIHDITAYIFYTSHDQNRYIEKPTNIIYRFGNKFTRLPVLLLSPIISIGFAYLIQFNTQIGSFVTVLIFVAVMHYYNEGFMWKRDSLHRKYIDFAF